MLTLPADLIIEKNKVYSNSPWLVLLDVTLPSTVTSHVRLLRNTEDILYAEDNYTAFPLNLVV